MGSPQEWLGYEYVGMNVAGWRVRTEEGRGMDGRGPAEDWASWEATRPLAPRAPRMLPAEAPGMPPLGELAGRRERGLAARPVPAPDMDVTQPYPPGRHPGGADPRRPGRPAGPGAPPVAPDRPRRRWGRIVRRGLLVLLVVLLVLAGVVIHRLYVFGQAISPRGPFTTQTGFMSGGERVNLVVLGYGGAGHDGAYLTDSILVISLIPNSGSTTLISVPRDLWVQVPPNSGQYNKINAAYVDGLDNGYSGVPAGRMAGGAEAAAKVSAVIGLSVPYWLTVDFTGFRALVDALGGVEVNVQTAFTAQYPINDNPAINAGWKTIHFNAGPQRMNGEQAIEYARARYVTDPPSEGSDFARSVRQQMLIRAIISRARQIGAWPGLNGATDALQQSIYTNLSLADLALFSMKMNFNSAHRVGLTDQNVLVDAQSGDGQDILLPANGDWTAIQRYVAAQLAG